MKDMARARLDACHYTAFEPSNQSDCKQHSSFSLGLSDLFESVTGGMSVPVTSPQSSQHSSQHMRALRFLAISKDEPPLRIIRFK